MGKICYAEVDIVETLEMWNKKFALKYFNSEGSENVVFLAEDRPKRKLPLSKLLRIPSKLSQEALEIGGEDMFYIYFETLMSSFVKLK